MARDQRTRLNGEVANRYTTTNAPRKAPGRGVNDELAEPLVEDDVEGEASPVEDAAALEAAHEPRKSIFELPRKEPSRQPLLSSSIPPAPSPAPAAPAAPATPPKGSRRG